MFIQNSLSKMPLIPILLWASLAWTGVDVASKIAGNDSVSDIWRKPDQPDNTVRNIAVAASVISAGVAIYTIARR